MMARRGRDEPGLAALALRGIDLGEALEKARELGGSGGQVAADLDGTLSMGWVRWPSIRLE